MSLISDFPPSFSEGITHKTVLMARYSQFTMKAINITEIKIIDGIGNIMKPSQSYIDKLSLMQDKDTLLISDTDEHNCIILKGCLLFYYITV